MSDDGIDCDCVCDDLECGELCCCCTSDSSRGQSQWTWFWLYSDLDFDADVDGRSATLLYLVLVTTTFLSSVIFLSLEWESLDGYWRGVALTVCLTSVPLLVLVPRRKCAYLTRAALCATLGGLSITGLVRHEVHPASCVFTGTLLVSAMLLLLSGYNSTPVAAATHRRQDPPPSFTSCT